MVFFPKTHNPNLIMRNTLDKSKLRDLEKVTAKIMKTIQKKAVDTNKMPEDKVKEYLDCNFDFNIMYGKLSNAGKL